jgi:hypothetical protein
VRDHFFSGLRRTHSGSSLSVRGGAVRTFGSLAIFAAFVMLSSGGYLIAEQFANPIEAGSATLLFAALMIATGLTLACPLLVATRRMRFTSEGKRPYPSGPRNGREITLVQDKPVV